MIASVSGRVERVGLDSAVVGVGGVGLLVHLTPRTAADLRHGASAQLSTSLVVREDALTLYGFADDDERELFDLVQTVSGVGPRLAMAMLAVHRPDVLRGAIGGGDLAVLTKVPGIGRKSAERLVLELRDKVGLPGVTVAGSPAPGTAPATDWRGQVVQALVGLGWPTRQADQAVEAVAGRLGDDPPVAGALRAALQELGR